MQYIAPTSTHAPDESVGDAPEHLAALTLETVPPLMRVIRTLMRDQAQAGADLTVQQFRALGFIERHHDASLTQVADHLGISMPSASRLVDALVNRALVERTLAQDRRKVTLNLSPAGAELRASARQRAQQSLSDTFQRLSPARRKALAKALTTLGDLFGGAAPAVATTRRAEADAAATERASP